MEKSKKKQKKLATPKLDKSLNRSRNLKENNDEEKLLLKDKFKEGGENNV